MKVSVTVRFDNNSNRPDNLVPVWPWPRESSLRSATTTLAKKKTATTIMHKIKTLFLSWDNQA